MDTAQNAQPIQTPPTAVHPIQPPVTTPSVPLVQQASSGVSEAQHSPGGVEREPIIGASSPIVEVPKPISTEVNVSQELKDIGVEQVTPHEPTVSAELEAMGMTVAPHVQPVSAKPLSELKLPMSYAEATANQKKYKLKDAIRWISAIIAYQWRKINPKEYK